MEDVTDLVLRGLDRVDEGAVSVEAVRMGDGGEELAVPGARQAERGLAIEQLDVDALVALDVLAEEDARHEVGLEQLDLSGSGHGPLTLASRTVVVTTLRDGDETVVQPDDVRAARLRDADAAGLGVRELAGHGAGEVLDEVAREHVEPRAFLVTRDAHRPVAGGDGLEDAQVVHHVLLDDGGDAAGGTDRDEAVGSARHEAVRGASGPTDTAEVQGLCRTGRERDAVGLDGVVDQQVGRAVRGGGGDRNRLVLGRSHAGARSTGITLRTLRTGLAGRARSAGVAHGACLTDGALGPGVAAQIDDAGGVCAAAHEGQQRDDGEGSSEHLDSLLDRGGTVRNTMNASLVGPSPF